MTSSTLCTVFELSHLDEAEVMALLRQLKPKKAADEVSPLQMSLTALGTCMHVACFIKHVVLLLLP